MTSNIPYGPMADEILDQCVPIGAPPLRPGIIFIHSGGWQAGDKSHYDGACMSFAARGYVATSINYRLTSGGYQWPDQIGDVQLAVRYMRANASVTGMDPNRMCAFSDSVGAHLALLLDELQTIHPADVANLYPTLSPSVMCVIDQFAPTDLTNLYDEGRPFVQRDIVNLLDGQTPTQNPAIYADASPTSNITAQTGPVLIIQGTLDTTVPPNQSTELQADLQAAGVSVQYISYVGGHEYSGLTIAQIDAIHAQMTTFLQSELHP
jgi:acetyl esterase/lipase